MKNLSRKEAAKVLEDMKVKIEIPKAAVTQWERNTALDMAIEVLKYSGVPNSSDCIVDKRDVLEIFADLYQIFEDSKEICAELDKVYDRLNALGRDDETAN